MAKFSTGLRNGMLSDTGFLEALDGGVLKIFSATTPPATADAAETGTLLMVLTAGGGATGLTFEAPVDGILTKTASEVWMTDAVTASGTCTYFRFVAPGDTGAASTTAPRVQGSVGLMNSDMNLTSTAVTEGEPWTLNYFSVGLPTM